jgi:dipeptidyl-peptidase-3
MILRAAWSGSRIIFRQVSIESNAIFDFILALYNGCDGNWQHFADASSMDIDDIESFLDYAATFLSNMGNYFVVPELFCFNILRLIFKLGIR